MVFLRCRLPAQRPPTPPVRCLLMPSAPVLALSAVHRAIDYCPCSSGIHPIATASAPASTASIRLCSCCSIIGIYE
ncbi:unnamed protein product [Victoria cruziana]